MRINAALVADGGRVSENFGRSRSRLRADQHRRVARTAAVGSRWRNDAIEIEGIVGAIHGVHERPAIADGNETVTQGGLEARAPMLVADELALIGKFETTLRVVPAIFGDGVRQRSVALEDEIAALDGVGARVAPIPGETAGIRGTINEIVA